MYKTPIMHGTTIKVENKTAGESIEEKVIRLLDNKEPIKDGVPIIFTDRAEGVGAGYNIRTDRWEIAVDAMERLEKTKTAKRDDKGAIKETEKKIIKETEMKIIKEDGKAEPTQGKAS
ncbi:MAG: hypothetical protein [Microviridae sp.]|nr:MAG: hypothetical protein [Microviridae sp.]